MRTKKSSLAVVIPNFNHGCHLKVCLDSVLTQSRAPDRVIVIDDASTDNSREVIQSFADQYANLEFQKNERNLGVVATTKKGLAAVTEDYVYMMAADDILFPGFFEKTMELLEKNPEASICCTHSANLFGNRLDLNDDLKRPSVNPVYLSPDEVVASIKNQRLWIPGHTAVVKTSACREAGEYIPELRWYSDWFLIHVLAFRKGLCYVPDALAAFRFSHVSYSAHGGKNRDVVAELVWNILNLLASKKYQDVQAKFFASDVFRIWPDFRHEISMAPRHWRSWQQKQNYLGAGGKINTLIKEILFHMGGDTLLSYVRWQRRRFLGVIPTQQSLQSYAAQMASKL